MIYIVTIFMVKMQVGSQFPNIPNKVKKKMCGACVSFNISLQNISKPKETATNADLNKLKEYTNNENKDLEMNNYKLCVKLMFWGFKDILLRNVVQFETCLDN